MGCKEIIMLKVFIFIAFTSLVDSDAKLPVVVTTWNFVNATVTGMNCNLFTFSTTYLHN